jgi:hypothetical protein
MQWRLAFEAGGAASRRRTTAYQFSRRIQKFNIAPYLDKAMTKTGPDR